MIDILATLAAEACPPDDPYDVYSRRIFALVPTIIILVLSILTYGLRVYCRKKTGQGIRSDDILMGIGLFISFEPAICEFLCKTRLGWSVSVDDFTHQDFPSASKRAWLP